MTRKNKNLTANITYTQAGVSCFVGQGSNKFKVQLFVGSSVVRIPACVWLRTVTTNAKKTMSKIFTFIICFGIMQTTFGQMTTEKEKSLQAVLDKTVDNKKVFGTSFAFKNDT